MTLKQRWAEQLADGRRLVRETYAGAASYTREGVLVHSFSLTEAKADSGTLGTLQATIAQADIINRNRRLYSQTVYELAVGRAQALITAGKFLGEVDHPWMGSLEGAAFRWTKVWMDGAYMRGEAVILTTSKGTLLKSLLDGKVGVGISTRGYASYIPEMRELEGVPVEIDIIGEDYTMEGIDAVLFESNQAGAITSHSESTHHTNREDTVKLTLEQLRKDNAELVAQIEAAAREGYIAQAEVETQVAAAKLAGVTEGTEQGKQAALADESVKQALAIADALKGVVKVEQKPATESAEVTESAALTAKVAELTQKLEAEQTARAARETAEQAAAAKQAVSAKVESLLTGFAHKDLVNADALRAAESVDVAEAAFNSQKALIEAAIARASVQSAASGTTGVGAADVNTGENDVQLTDEQKVTLEDVNHTRKVSGQPVLSEAEYAKKYLSSTK